MNDLALKGQRVTKILLGAYFSFILLWLLFQILFTLEFNSNGLIALIFAWLGIMAYGGANWARWALVCGVILWNILLAWMFTSIMAWQTWTTPILSAYLGVFIAISLLFVGGLSFLKSVHAFFAFQQQK